MKWMLVAYCLAGTDCAPTAEVSVFHFRTEAECTARAADLTSKAGEVGACTDACLGSSVLDKSACKAAAGSCGEYSSLEPGGRWCVADWKLVLKHYSENK